MGSYVANNLAPGETIVYEAKEHWISIFSLRAILSLWILWVLDRMTQERVITSKRVIAKKGLIWRKTFEMNISKIESVGVDQSILGRILGYGTVVVIGTGGTRGVIDVTANPVEFRTAFQQLQA